MMKQLFAKLPYLQGERITLRPLTVDDADSLRELTQSTEVYRYLPTFLLENKYEDKAYVIEHLYDECLETSLILGIFMGDDFCGLAEFYGYEPSHNKISIGKRLLQRYWGKGVATEAMVLMVKYLKEETDVKVIAASVMAKNRASGAVLKKNGFTRTGYTVLENWGHIQPILTEKWVRKIERE